MLERLDFSARFGNLPSMMVISHLIVLKEDRVALREGDDVRLKEGCARVVYGDFIAIGQRAGGDLGLLDTISGSLFPFTSIAEIVLSKNIVDAYIASVKARHKEECDEKASKPT